jgi:sulfur-oxidizing protein SoxZ
LFFFNEKYIRKENMAEARKSMVKFKPKKFNVGDTIKVDFIVIHPMETGTRKDKKTNRYKKR